MSDVLERRLKEDFRYFMTLLFKEQGLTPSKMQLLFADILQKETSRRLIMLGYRGFAKTLITGAYKTWRLYKDPTQQHAIWGSSEDSAGDTTKMMLKWLEEIPWLNHLAPTGKMDASALSFDVQGRGLFRGSSVMAFGISGSVTGSRADDLLVDDPETSSNGDTAKKRISIDRAMNEASYVIKTGGTIKVLGTIHFDDSLYLRLLQQGYKLYIFPMAVPDAETAKQCWPYYPEPIRKMIESLPEGAPLDRFNEEEISIKRATGELSYIRQILCNPFRTSKSQKPFDMGKIIVFDASKDALPVRFYHAKDDAYLNNEVMGFSSASLTDKLYNPYKYDTTTRPYERKVLWVDPAEGGTDEVAVVVAGACGGYLVCLSSEGLMGGSSIENLERIIERARYYDVDEIIVEGNFGGGAWAQLLRSHYFIKYGRFGRQDNMIPVSTKANTKNKEKRIIALLDPVINGGRLVVTPSAFMIDYESANGHSGDNKMCYRLSYQLSYFQDGGVKLEHDDRIDALASCAEVLGNFLTDSPIGAAETWEDWLLEEVFRKEEVMFEDKKGPKALRDTVRRCYLRK